MWRQLAGWWTLAGDSGRVLVHVSDGRTREIVGCKLCDAIKKMQPPRVIPILCAAVQWPNLCNSQCSCAVRCAWLCWAAELCVH